MTEQEIYEQFESVVEMTEAGDGLVPLDAATVAEITAGDDNPKFATFVIESGWSKSNRYWGPELFDNVAEQINNGTPIVGYQGHIKPEDDPYSFPEIQLQWIKGKVIRSGENAKLAVKAYVLPGTKARSYLDRKKPLVNSVSWRGKALQIPFEKGVRVKKYLIESIDLSRPRAQGMNAQLVGDLTSEMEGGTQVKTEEIAALSVNDLRTHNPNVVTEIETAATKPLNDQVNEMTTEAEKTKPVVDLIPDFKKMLKLDDSTDDLTVLSKALEHIKETGKNLRDGIISRVLDKKFKDPMLVRVITSEMATKDISITGNDAADMKTVSEMVTDVIDHDEELKKMVSEMEGGSTNLGNSGGRDLSGGSNGESRELKAGTTTSNLRVRSRQ